nr:MAG: replication associated protein [Cressdnaviricota sp.]
MDKTQGRKWILTINNPIIEWDEIVKTSCADYACGQLEKGESGTIHWQLAIWYKCTKRFAFIKKLFPEAHIELMNSDKGFEYCTKEDTRIKGPFEHGTSPVKRNSKTDWEKVWEWAKSGDLEKIDPKIRVTQYKTLRTIRADNLKPQTQKDVRGIWVWGEPGIGKSHFARVTFSEDKYYIKSANKWWDGYRGESIVILEDLDKGTAEHLGHFLKIWADKWGFRGEVKFGGEAPNFQKLIVTSNYSINELFTEPSLREAITRRFEVFQMVRQDSFLDQDQEIQTGEDIRATHRENLNDSEETTEDKKSIN